MLLLLANLALFILLLAVAVRLFLYFRSAQRMLILTGHTKTGYIRFRYTDGVILELSDGAMKVLELDMSRKDMIGRDIRELFIRADDQADFIEALKADGGRLKGEMLHFITLNGREKWLLHNSEMIRDPHTGDMVVQIMAEDITEEKRSLRTMVETERKYEQLFRTSGDMIILFDFKTGIIDEANPATEVMTGYTEQELEGREFELLIHPFRRKEFQRYKKELLFKNVVRMEGKLVLKKGDYKEVWITMNKFDLKGKKKIMADIQDITELAREREEQQKRRSELEKFCKASIAREERVKKLREELMQTRRQIDLLRSGKEDERTG